MYILLWNEKKGTRKLFIHWFLMSHQQGSGAPAQWATCPEGWVSNKGWWGSRAVPEADRCRCGFHLGKEVLGDRWVPAGQGWADPTPPGALVWGREVGRSEDPGHVSSFWCFSFWFFAGNIIVVVQLLRETQESHLRCKPGFGVLFFVRDWI
jgi:hypothetical protein